MKFDASFTEKFRKVATMFLVRDGWSRENAAAEIDAVITRVGVEALAKGLDTKYGNIEYVKMSRLGLRNALDRKKRVTVGLLLNNALNHAEFE